MKNLVHVEDRVMADSMVALLKANGIESYSQAPGIGGLMHIGLGRSTSGYDIFVDDNKFDDAKELVSYLALFEDDMNPATDDEIWEIERVRRRRRLFQRSIAIIVLLILAGALLSQYVG